MQEPNRRSRQVANAIREELVTIARSDISDPRLERVGMITFSGVELADDYRNATVWVSFMGKTKDSKEVQEALEALQSASKFIHRLLIKRIPMKVHPHLSFKYDPAFDRAAVIGEALESAAQVEKNAALEKAKFPTDEEK